MGVNIDGRGKEFCLQGCDENALKLTPVVAAQLCDYTKNERTIYFKYVTVCYVNYS